MEEKKLTDEEIINALDKTKQELANISPEDDDYDKLLTVKTIVDYCHDLIHRLQENNANQVRMRCDMQRKFDDLQNLCTEQRAENEQLKKDYIELDLECRELRTELDKELADNEEFTKEANEEIERLTEENEYLDMCGKQFLADYQKCEVERAELENQVNELKKERENVQKILYELGKCGNDKERYAVWVKLIKYCGVEVE